MAGTGTSANLTRPHVPASAGQWEQSGRSFAPKQRAGSRSKGPQPGASIPNIRSKKEANTLAPCPAPESAVRFSFRPGTVRAILLGGPAPGRHRRKRPLVAQGTFVRALTEPGWARESVAHEDTPGVFHHPRGGSGTLGWKGSLR
jgi:hypothetical protein